METIAANNVIKTYKDGTKALRGISMGIQSDEIFCVVGPNGAGKTTLMRIIGTQLMPSNGSLTILGIDVVKNAADIRKHLAVVPQEVMPDLQLTAEEHVFYYLCTRGENRVKARSRTEEYLKLLNMWEHRKKPALKLSGGLRRRILIAMAMATGADILLLDEPTSGLDPVARRETWNLLNELKVSRTIVLTTHSMEEAEAIADRVAIINSGVIISFGTVGQLRQRLPTREKIYIGNGMRRESVQRFGKVETYGGRLVLYPKDQKAIDEVVHLAVDNKFEISVLPTTLEDVYVEFVSGARQ